jgi:hypothetical protein
MPLTIKPSSGSGSATIISVTGTTTNDTLTLPARTGNIITSADSGTVTGTMLSTGGPTWDTSGNVTATGTLAMASSFKRNRIINGDMTVFQRGTAATVDLAYSVDRWQLIKGNDATESVTQNADAPTGFNYSLRDTVSVADTSIGAAQFSGLQQVIEGYNIAGLGFGTASAKSVTLSFWVRSTVTGQYVGSIRNATDTQVCPFNFTINQSNTWEYKTNTFPGSTTGVWNTTNGIGLYVLFYSALGSSFLGGTANTWGASPNYGCGTPVNGLNANGNIFAITGVQVEEGSVATPYERQIFNEQLAQCQRYFEMSYDVGTVPGTATATSSAGTFPAAFATYFPIYFSVKKRSSPTVTTYSPFNGATGNYSINQASNAVLAGSIGIGTSGFTAYAANSTNVSAYLHWTASSEL